MQDETKSGRGWTIASVFFGVALVGASAAQLIPAFAGLERTDPPGTSLGPVLWAGLLGLALRKSAGRSGGIGFAGGAVLGLLIPVASAFVLGYQKGNIANETYLAEIRDQVASLNSQFPQEIDGGLRIDRVDFDKNTIHYYLSYTKLSTAESDVGILLSEQRTGSVEGICGRPDLQAVLAEGVSYEYHYDDRDGANMFEFAVSERDCQ